MINEFLFLKILHTPDELLSYFAKREYSSMVNDASPCVIITGL